MPRGSKPGERRGGRRRGTPNKTTALRDAVFCAAAAKSNGSPLDFMLGLMRDPNVLTDLRIEMAAAAARFVHARPQAARRVHTNPLDSSPISSSPDLSAPKMEEELSAPGQSVDGEDDLSPLGFLLSVMNDPDATSQQRIKAAKIAAQYKHTPVAPDKVPSADEYGFTIRRTLAKAICDDWRRLDYLEMILRPADTVAEATAIRARQADRYQFLQCPPGYSPDRDSKRAGELLNKKQWSMAEETELAFVIARITASEAAFHRSPEGRTRRRIIDLQARRKAAMAARDRSVGLTRAEGKELDELLEKYPPKRLPSEGLRYLGMPSREELVGRSRVGAGRSLRPATGADLSEMEELPPTLEEQAAAREAQEAELIARRKAAGDPDPWGGKPPRTRIYELEQRCYRSAYGGDFTPAEEDELQEIARVYPEEVEKLRQMVERRPCGEKLGAERAGWAGKRGAWQLD